MHRRWQARATTSCAAKRAYWTPPSHAGSCEAQLNCVENSHPPETRRSADTATFELHSLGKAIPDPWRVRPSQHAMQLVDIYMFLLGRYPSPPLHAKTTLDSPPSMSSSRATAAVLDKKPRGSAVRERHRRLDALSSKSPVATTVTSSQPPSRSASERFRAFQHHPWKSEVNNDDRPTYGLRLPTSSVRFQQESSADLRRACDTPIEDIHPLTPLEDVRVLAQAWMTKQSEILKTEARAAADEETRWSALLSHPHSLFEDEAAVLQRFGMGGRASSAKLKPLAGLFRQRWQDFHVTELTADWGTPEGYRAVSRHFNFSVPPPPAHVLSDEEAEEGASRTPASRECTGGPRSKVAPDPGFFLVEVGETLQRLKAELRADGGGSAKGGTPSEDYWRLLEHKEAALIQAEKKARDTRAEPRPACKFFLQCTMHKQHLAHSMALAALAQVLRVHPRAISVAGMKDYIGDTVQRVRLADVSPQSALAANRLVRPHHGRLTLSDFSYEAAPLSPGDLYGNHFRIVLRGVTASKTAVHEALEAFQRDGFPNYYGCQRFSWFGGCEDAAFALLHHNWLVFAFRFLNYTEVPRSLRSLLQREKKYPHPVQDEYRRNVVRRLRQIALEPGDLDQHPFLTCPSLTAPLDGGNGQPLSSKHQLVLWQLREAFFDLHGQSRRLTAQRLSSYLWNQVLTLRLHHCGGAAVLLGDHVAPAGLRQRTSSAADRQDFYRLHGNVVSEANRYLYSIADVVHPGFSFEGGKLPDNVVGAYYRQVCGKYRVDWGARHARSGLKDFLEPPRPIIRFPQQLSYEHDEPAETLTVSFALERGCYANVAITELLQRSRCAGAEDVQLLPAPEGLWSSLGTPDPGYVTSMQDVYVGYEDGLGFANDTETVPQAESTQVPIWDHKGALFLPDAEDPYRKAYRWGQRNLLRNMQRREADAEAMKRQLFEKPLADQLTEDEISSYAGHTVPLPPNVRGKKIFFKVLRRKRRYAGAPKVLPRVQRGAQLPNHTCRTVAPFKALNRNTWNVTW